MAVLPPGGSADRAGASCTRCPGAAVVIRTAAVMPASVRSKAGPERNCRRHRWRNAGGNVGRIVIGVLLKTAPRRQASRRRITRATCGSRAKALKTPAACLPLAACLPSHYDYLKINMLRALLQARAKDYTMLLHRSSRCARRRWPRPSTPVGGGCAALRCAARTPGCPAAGQRTGARTSRRAACACRTWRRGGPRGTRGVRGRPAAGRGRGRANRCPR